MFWLTVLIVCLVLFILFLIIFLPSKSKNRSSVQTPDISNARDIVNISDSQTGMTVKIDYDAIDYDTIARNILDSHPELQKMSKEEANVWLKQRLETYEKESEKEILEIERNVAIEKLSGDLHHVVVVLASLSLDPSPLPQHVIKELDKLEEVHQRILDSMKSDLFSDALNSAKQSVLYDEMTMGSPEEMKKREAIFEQYAIHPDTFDVKKFKEGLYDTFFRDYRAYWENAILNLVRKSAIINRRKYLVERIDEFMQFLHEQDIQKFDKLLQDYRQFNLDELQKLEMSKSDKK